MRGTYRATRDVVSMPPPSSGGVHLINCSNIMERFPIRETGPQTAATIHVMTEAMKLAFADRAEWLADPDFVKIPLAGLISEIRGGWRRDFTRSRAALRRNPQRPIRPRSKATRPRISLSWMRRAMRSPIPTTLNFSYGLGLVAEGTGVLLNNELDDFAAKPGAPNAFGLVGGKANAPGPRKHFVVDDPDLRDEGRQDRDRHRLAGRPARIITTVLEQISRHDRPRIECGGSHGTGARFHHQWLPDVLLVERACRRYRAPPARQGPERRDRRDDGLRRDDPGDGRAADGRRRYAAERNGGGWLAPRDGKFHALAGHR